MSFEIRDPMHGPIRLNPKEMRIVDSPFFQRLRGIKQTGFAELAFPGATHNRYTHSLGAFHLAGNAFNQIFKNFPFQGSEERERLWHCLRMAALLHDVGHGPLSHAIEQAMPARSEVLGGEGQATHEDYTEAIVSRSSLAALLRETFDEKIPEAIVSLIRCENRVPDYFVVGDEGVDCFPVMSSLISGEIDVDRMDYMPRDSRYCGITYGHFDLDWLFSNLMLHQMDEKAFLAIDSRAIYTIEDFLLSRYHMYLMVYLHHKSVVYDEMLFQFLQSDENNTRLPSDVEDYLVVDDYWLREKLRQSKSPWAQRILNNKPYRMLLELHSQQDETAKGYADELETRLKKEGTSYFRSSSTGLLSKYRDRISKGFKSFPLFVIYSDPRFASSRNPGVHYESIDDATDLFSRYKKKRIIDRIYADVPR